MTTLSPPNVIRRSLGFIHLGLVLGLELLKAAWQTLKCIYAPRGSLRPAILAVPLDAGSPMGITFFANMITLTPGTTTLDVSQDHHLLYVHALDITDAQAAIQDMKNTLETAARKVFP